MYRFGLRRGVQVPTCRLSLVEELEIPQGCSVTELLSPHMYALPGCTKHALLVLIEGYRRLATVRLVHLTPSRVFESLRPRPQPWLGVAVVPHHWHHFTPRSQRVT